MSVRIAVSACLLGHRVRYNGDSKSEDWIIDVLSKEAELIPICPEMEMGLGAPRETMSLAQDSSEKPIRLRTNDTGVDLTARARESGERILSRVGMVDAMILKKNSPSCGVAKVKIYGPTGIPHAHGQGIFAEMAARALPGLPMIEEGRLRDPFQRELFLTRVFTLARFREELGADRRKVISTLQRFHQHHKFLLLSHDPGGYVALGRIASNSEGRDESDACREYRERLAQALACLPTEGKRVNALQHIFGFFKDALKPREKEHFQSILEDYRSGVKPFSAVLTLLEHLGQRFEKTYVLKQMIFAPFPRNLRRQVTRD